jgi:hypothetical protein
VTSCSECYRHQLTKVRHVFTSKTRTTWIELVPLDFDALSALVSTTLQRPKDDVAPLTRLIHRVSMGNPFSARNLLITVRRQGHVGLLFSSTILCLRAILDMVRMGSQHLAVCLALALAVLGLIFCQIQPHRHRADRTRPCLCAYRHIIPYFSFP